MDDLKLLVDLHLPAGRQGPGGEAETLMALELARLDRSRPLKIADIGCGTGASALLLARELDAEITAVDLFREFLDELASRALDQGVNDQITTLNCSMDALPFADGEFDVIWSEGAAYNMGFKAAVSAWSRFLKPGGTMVVSEITWLSAKRPAEIQSYWEHEYPEIDFVSAKVRTLERLGFSPEAHFVLPQHCWTSNYYRPMQDRFDEFLGKHCGSEQAAALIETERREIALYEQYSDFYGYYFFIARKLLS